VINNVPQRDTIDQFRRRDRSTVVNSSFVAALNSLGKNYASNEFRAATNTDAYRQIFFDLSGRDA